MTKFIQLHDPKQPHVSRVQTNVDAVLRPVAEAVAATPMGGAKPPPWIQPGQLLSDFANLANFPLTAFHKDALGYVWVKIGLVTPGGTGGFAPMFDLPIGYRPSENVSFYGVSSAGTLAPVDIFVGGHVRCAVALGGGVSVISYFAFLAEQ